MNNRVTIETDHSTITYDKDSLCFSGMFQQREINNEDLFRDLASENKIPLRERQTIANEFAKVGELDIVLLIDLPSDKG